MAVSLIEGMMGTIVVISIFAPAFLFVALVLLPTCTGCKPFEARFTFLKILALLLFFAMLAGLVSLYQAREYFYDHFEEYRCKPWFMPLVSFVRKDISAMQNFEICTRKSSLMALGSLSRPLLSLSSQMSNNMNYASKHVDTTAGLAIRAARDASFKVEQSNAQMSRFTNIIRYLFAKLKSIFDKMLAIIFNVYFALVTIVDFIQLVFLVPEMLLGILKAFFIGTVSTSVLSTLIGAYNLYQGITYLSIAVPMLPWTTAAVAFGTAQATYGAAWTSLGIVSAIVSEKLRQIHSKLDDLNSEAESMSYCCFDARTHVLLENGRCTRVAADVAVGNRLYGGAVVLGVMCVRSDANDWFRVGPRTVVAAGHRMWCPSSASWRMVGGARAGGTRVSRRGRRLRYNFITSDHRVPTADGVWFQDAQETSDPRALAAFARATLCRLNGVDAAELARKGEVCEHLERGERASGFSLDARVPIVRARRACAEAEEEAGAAEGAVTTKPLREVVIGDHCAVGGEVLGVVDLDGGDEGEGRSDDLGVPWDQIVWDASSQRWRKRYAVQEGDVAAADRRRTRRVPPPLSQPRARRRFRRHLITRSGKFLLAAPSPLLRSRAGRSVVVRDFNEQLRATV